MIQMEYRSNNIPRNISFAQGDCCSVGSLTSTSSLTYSEDGVVVTTCVPHPPPQRWNCDAGLDPNARQRYSKTASKRISTISTNHGGSFDDPEFFPPLVSMMQSQQSLLSSYYDDEEDENDPSLKRRFSCSLFGTNRISTHARMEMLRHQMSKPFRALPTLPTPPMIDASCIGKGVLESVINQVQNAGTLNCNMSRKLVQQGKKETVGAPVEEVLFVPAFEGFPSKTEKDNGQPRKSIKDHLENSTDQFHSFSTSTSQSFDFSIDKGELSLSNDTHWLSLVATDESSVEETEVVLKLELD